MSERSGGAYLANCVSPEDFEAGYAAALADAQAAIKAATTDVSMGIMEYERLIALHDAVARLGKRDATP